jgi:hypothetical protein
MGKGEWTTAHFQMHRSRGSSGRKEGGGGTFWWIAIMLVAVVAIIAGLAKFGPDGVKDAVASGVETGISGVIWVVDGARGLLSRNTSDNPEALGFERLGESGQQDLYAVP